MQTEIKATVQVEIDLQLRISWSCANDGIGAYEYQGVKGNDQGIDYIAIDDVRIITPEAKLHQQILDQINDEELSERIESQLKDC